MYIEVAAVTLQKTGVVQHLNHTGNNTKRLGRNLEPVVKGLNHFGANRLSRMASKVVVGS